MKEKSQYPTGLAGEGKARNDGRRDEKLEVGRAIEQVRYKRSSNLDEIMKDGASASLTEHAPESSSLNLPEAKGPKQKVQDGHSTKTKCISVLAGQGTQDEQSPGGGNAKHESEKIQRLSKSKKKKDLNLPRRASKRLAGIEVDTVPELKASTRARRVGSKQSDNSAGCTFQQPEKQDFASVVQEEHDKAEEKPGVPPDSPLADFFTDPCIAFAIKTLKDHSGNGETDMSYEKQECNVFPPPGNLVKQEKHDGIVGTGEKSGSSITEPPFGSSWPDPCIEFAIKTLTGAIPLEYDPHIEEYFQKQLGSSQQHKDNLLQKEIA
ncbi:hypothetical protein RchiOBHm_Chr1g0377031 [Rosa chinensis]|uniref:Uncharacterized protein n=1 Tax=Rosa chinensis TaxID=74649 RepID=A0A2P6SN34_ROSCH|nr:uncharacterized protein LOC112176197 isoform X2 [Rosa chinensis]PRQ60063.1 hypothetical protein RchiOBHm_Chr1g0377031 [Rosa chinensis]